MIAFKNSTNALQGARPGSSQSEGPSRVGGVPEQPEKPTLAQGLRLTRGRRRRFGPRRVCSPNSSPGCRPPAFRVRKSCKAIPSWTSRITPAAPEIAGELVGVGSHKDTEPTLTLARLAHLHARFALPDKEKKQQNPAVLCWEPECTAALRRLFALLAVTRGTCCGSTAS